MCNIIHIYTVMGWVIGYTLQQYKHVSPTGLIHNTISTFLQQKAATAGMCPSKAALLPKTPQHLSNHLSHSLK